MSDRAGVLLDLDGTLIDTAPDLVAAVNALRRQRCLDEIPLVRLRNSCSYGARGMLGAALELAPGEPGYDEARQQFLNEYRARLTTASRPFTGMREALQQLGDYRLRWGVVTNKVEAYAGPLIDAMAFDPPPACVIGGDSAGVAKPDPAPLLLGCERAGFEPRDTIYVGDSERDIAAGRAAGMHTIGAAYGYFEADEPVAAWSADAIIETPDELAAAVMRFASPQASGASLA